jgi:hypothetical protein
MDFTFRAAVVVAFVLVTASAGAQTLRDFTKIVDFKATLESLNGEATANRSVSTDGKLVILNGVVESIQSLSNDPKQFYAMIELIDGKWHGSQSVSLYRCYVLVRGGRFASQVLLRPRRNPPPDAVGPNSQLLVVGSVQGVVAAPDGGNVPVIEAYFIRRLN